MNEYIFNVKSRILLTILYISIHNLLFASTQKKQIIEAEKAKLFGKAITVTDKSASGG